MRLTALLAACVLSFPRHGLAEVGLNNTSLELEDSSPSSEHLDLRYLSVIKDRDEPVSIATVMPGIGVVVTLKRTTTTLDAGLGTTVSVIPSVTASSDFFTLPTVPVIPSVTASSDIYTLPTVPAIPTKSTGVGFDLVKRIVNNLFPRDDNPDENADDDTDTSDGPCKRGDCGNSCGNNGGGAWVALDPINCANIPIETATADSETGLKRRDDNPDPDPLPDPPGLFASVKYLRDIQGRIHNAKEWLDIEAGITVGKWHPFGKEKVVAGMNGLRGCTAVFIISDQGAYVSHIFEEPAFQKWGGKSVSDDWYFEMWAFDALIYGNEAIHDVDKDDPDETTHQLDPLGQLYGTTEKPGPLHYTHRPKIVIVSPLEKMRGPFKWGARVDWLSGKLHDYFYPPDSAATEYAEDVIKFGYKIVNKAQSEGPTNIDGKAMIEFNPLDKYEKSDEKLTPMARWRVWSSGKQAANGWFANPSAVGKTDTEAEGLTRRDDAICPVPDPDTETTACVLGKCGDACTGNNGGGSWVTLGPIDCAKIPIETATIVAKKRDDLPEPTPLPELPEYGIPLMRYLGNMQEKLFNEVGYLDHETETTGKWYPFGKDKVVGGVDGLFGCTAVFAITDQGAYMAHIWEVPVFKDNAEATDQTSDDYFEKWTYDTLINGNKDSSQLDPLKGLYGTTADPGPLHYTRRPKIYILSPFKTGGRGPFRYDDRINWLSDKLRDFFYPPEASEYAQEILAMGYKYVRRAVAEDIRGLDGKAILEYNPLDKYEKSGDQITPMARWRLFSSGFQVGDEWFENQAAVGNNARRGLDIRDEAICPLPDLSASASVTPTVTSTSTLIATSASSFPAVDIHTPSSTPTTNTLPSNPSSVAGPTCTDTDFDAEDRKLDQTKIKTLANVCINHMLPTDTDTMGPHPENITWSVGKGWGKWYYTAEIRFKEGCDGPEQNLVRPMEGYDCASVLEGNFADCPMGGETRVGCLVYEAKAFRDKSFSE